MLPGPRIRGSTSAIAIANAATSASKPNTRSFQVARLAVSHQINNSAQQPSGPIMANIQYFAKPPSRNSGTNRAATINTARSTAGQTRSERKAGLVGELDSAGTAWSFIGAKLSVAQA